LTLAASESEKSSPKVSKLPLPISDSPLVIDLPDGQKIVVGKMTLGSVIEVATWRGVGRPDSRTSRLMLGMGSGNVNEDSDSGETNQSQGERKAPVKPKGFAGFIFTLQHFAKNFSRINWSGTVKALFASMGSKKKRVAKPQASNSETSVQSKSASPADIKPAVTISRVSEDADIEEWLNKITQKAARETTAKKPVAKSTGSSAVKPKASVKKAAPKASNPRSTKR
jgi:hypothetical protein